MNSGTRALARIAPGADSMAHHQTAARPKRSPRPAPLCRVRPLSYASVVALDTAAQLGHGLTVTWDGTHLTLYPTPPR